MNTTGSAQNNLYNSPLPAMENSLMDLSLANTSPSRSSVKIEKRKPAISLLDLPPELLENIIAIAEGGAHIASSSIFKTSKYLHVLLPNVLLDQRDALDHFIRQALDNAIKYKNFQDTLKQLKSVWDNVQQLNFMSLPFHHVKNSFIVLMQCCPNLQKVTLYDSALSDQDYEILGTLATLKHFELDQSSVITGSFLTVLPSSIESLKFSHTTITNTSLLSINRFSNLNTLHLVGCDAFTGIGFQKLHLQNLQSFRLQSSSITDHRLANLFRLMPNLRKLYLNSCSQITGDCLKNLRFKELEIFAFSSNRNITDSILIALPKIATLKQLNLYGCSRLTGAGFAKMCSSSPSLEILNLSATNITDDEFALLPKMAKLRELNLDDCRRFTGAGFAKICFSFSVLEYLSLSGTNIGDDEFILFPKMARLQRLDLTACPRFTGVGFAKMDLSFPALEILSLYSTIIGEEQLIKLPQMPNLHRVYMTADLDSQHAIKKILHSKTSNNLFSVFFF